MLTIYQTPAYRNAMNEAKKCIALAVTLAEIGGVQVFLLEFAQYLKKMGHEVTILAGSGAWLSEQAKTHGINFIRLNHMRRDIHPIQDILAIRELNQLFHQHNFDAVHLNSTKMGVLGSIAGNIAKIDRIVYRIGGWVFLEKLPSWKRQIYIYAERFTARFKDTIICVNPSDETEAAKHSIKPKSKVITIPNGIDFVRFESNLLSKNEARTKLGLKQDNIVIGSVSNFYAPKNIPAYIDTIRDVIDQNPSLHFVLIGDGPERKLIEQKITDLNLTESITLAGEQNNASALLHAFDIFTLPSTKEGMSWSLLEAMAASLPCIATDVGAAKWMLGDTNGIIVPPSDTQALTRAILELANNESKRFQLGQNAKEAVQNRFPLEKTLSGNASTLLD
jgi:glycosyltransferase involved in cell wall biosynthesis